MIAILFFVTLNSLGVLGQTDTPQKNLRVAGKSLKHLVKEQSDSFLDPNRNYRFFTGRVTDRDKGTNILKISSEDQNTKFFRAGDKVKFRLARGGKGYCESYIRSVEEGYFVLYIKEIFPCFGEEKYFRRGTLLIFDSASLAKRVKDASRHRVTLLKRKQDFYNQLNGVNHFLWSFDQQKVLVAAEFDKKLLQLRKSKEDALELLQSKRKDQLRLQKELVFRLDRLDHDLDFYRIDNTELLIDRWHLDHDLGLPVGRRPQKHKDAKNSYK